MLTLRSTRWRESQLEFMGLAGHKHKVYLTYYTMIENINTHAYSDIKGFYVIVSNICFPLAPVNYM